MRIRLLLPLLSLPALTCVPPSSSSSVSSADAVPLTIRVVDAETDELIAARVEIRASDGTFPLDRIALTADPMQNIEAHGFFIDGEATLAVRPGKTLVRASRGPQYTVTSTEITPSSQPVAIELRLDPVLRLQSRGWFAGDAHIHMIHGERQRATSYDEVAETCRAQGLDWAYVNQEYVGAGALDLSGLHAETKRVSTPTFQLFIGGERPKSVLGHNALIGVSDPFVIPDDPPYSAAARLIHDQGGVLFPVHPVRYYPSKIVNGVWRDFPGNNLGRELVFDAFAGPSFDGLSVLSDDPSDPNAHDLYFNLLNRRLFVPVFADSDACFDRPVLSRNAPGFYLTFFNLPSGARPDSTTLPAAVRRGRTFATTGPILLFSIDDQLPGETIPLDGKPHKLRVEAHHDHHTWTLDPSRLSKVEIIRDGRVIKTWLPDATDVTLETTITESKPSWYTARAYGSDAKWQVALSSPIYFAAEPVPQKQPAKIAKITGHIYDFFTGADRAAQIEIRRGDELIRSFAASPTFTAEMPIDATITAIAPGKEPLSHDLLLDYGPVHQLLWRLQAADLGDPQTFDRLESTLTDVSLDFPLGHRIPGCYRAAALAEDMPIPTAEIESAPSGQGGTIVTAAVLLDKRAVSPGDTIHIAAVFHDERAASTNIDPILAVEGLAYDPTRPSGYDPLKVFDAIKVKWSEAIDLGHGYRQIKGQLELAPWVAPGPNRAVDLSIRARLPDGADLSHIGLRLPLGETDRALMVAATWPTMPLSWPDHNYGIGPLKICNKNGRASQPMTDHRALHLRIGPYDLLPARDAEGHPRAKDAVYTDQYLDQILNDESHLVP